MTPESFVTLSNKDQYLKENVFFREVLLKAKVKEEKFKNEIYTRYYIQHAEYVADGESPEKCQKVATPSEDKIAAEQTTDKIATSNDQTKIAESNDQTTDRV